MSNYAVIQLAGKQHLVTEGDTLVLDRLTQEENKKFKVSDVLLVSQDKKLQVGTPLVSGATVELELVSHQKGDKIRVAKFKAKSRYRKVKGHRQHQSTVKVTKISAK